MQVDQLKLQIAAKGVTNATGIALADSGSSNSDPLSNASLTTSDGHTISVNLGSGPVSVGDRQAWGTWDQVRYFHGAISEGTPGRPGGIPMLPGGVSSADGSNPEPVKEF